MIEIGETDEVRPPRWFRLIAEDTFNSSCLAERRCKVDAFGEMVRRVTRQKAGRDQHSDLDDQAFNVDCTCQFQTSGFSKIGFGVIDGQHHQSPRPSFTSTQWVLINIKSLIATLCHAAGDQWIAGGKDTAMQVDKIGKIIWHDLLTSDRQRSMSFYERVAGWTYQTEHATDFVWGGGEKDFVLALTEDEAGAGFAETPPEMTDGWIAYVEVQDVDATVALAEKLGAAIVRRPFEVPGVGRNALFRDPFGALIGVSISRHSYPMPKQQFGPEIYLSEASTFPDEFYSHLFAWKLSPLPVGRQVEWVVIGPSGEKVAMVVSGKSPTDAEAVWLPSIKVAHPITSLNDAAALGGEPFSENAGMPARQKRSFLRDPDGALSCLLKA